ncbi:MAG TPA: hypothetical protein VKR57_09660 [Terriglobales bacterium]|nr:hypothetical protein [Terriglobales bacterium]
MICKSHRSFFALILSLFVVLTLTILTNCSSSNSSTPPPVVSIAATSGTPQSATVGAAFAAPLVATVTSGGSPASGVTVTFTAPSNGATGSFAGGANTATTNSSGVATSAVFTAGTTAGPYAVTASVSGAMAPASFSLTNNAGAAATITPTSGTPQGAALSSAFTAPLVTTVVDSDSNPVSGVTVTYTAPASGASGIFASNGTATETDTTNASGVATSSAFTANSTVGSYVVTAAVTGISAAADFGLTNAVTLKAGDYTFWLSGSDTNANPNSSYIPYYVAGAFTVDGTGAISGEQDFVDFNYVVSQISFTGSTAVTPDGNLQITLNTGNVCIGPGSDYTCGQIGSTSAGDGQEILNVTLTSLPSSTTSSARITEFDSWATAGGQLEPQTVPATTPLVGYAFSVGGLDGNGTPLGIGGVIDVDSSGNISGSNGSSVFDENDGGTLLQAQSFSPSTVDATPDGFGRVTFTLNPNAASGVPQIVLVAYFVNGTHLRLVEGADALVGTTGGQAFAQTGTGTFTTASFQGSSYVFQAGGSDSSTNGVLQVAGVVTGNADGTTASGNVSFNDLTSFTPQGGVAIASGAYTVDPTGRVTLTALTDNATFSYNVQLYLDGNGNARALSMDSSDEFVGVSNQQKGSLNGSIFSGTYAMGVIGVDPISFNEIDAVGPVVADGVGSFPGFVDLNWILSLSPGPTFADAPVSPATFDATGTPGVFTGNVTGLDVTNCQVYSPGGPGCTADAFTYYLVNASTVVGIENDVNQLTLLRFELQ